jgi:V/A-type H+-transporting ATPase subunit E
MSKLAEILQAEVEAEIKEILAQAEAKAAKIVSDAADRAAARVAEHRKKLDAEIRSATYQARSAGELTLSSARMQAKGEVVDLLQHKVRLALEEIASRPDYGEVLQALAQEAMGIAETAVAVTVHPDDQEKLSDWAQYQGLELKTDPELRLGVRIVSPRGATVENTLPERLRRAWGTLAPEVSGILWE